MKPVMVILRNAITCQQCKGEAVSRFRHDLQRCPCGNCFADGGKEYLRRGWTGKGAVECSWVECPSCKGDGCGECSEGVVSVETWARLVEEKR